MKIFLALLASVFAAEDQSQYNWEWINKAIDAKKITSIEEFLPALPDSLRRDYVLVYNSRSLQGAELQAPRVLMHWNHGKQVISFNGNPSQRGGSSIEMIQFNEAQRRFEFHRLDFDSGKPPKRDQNIRVCSGCHRADSRPNWEPYPEWPGVYGSKNDRYIGEEYENIEKFIPFSKTHPRYRYLVDIDKMLPTGRGDNAGNKPLTERLGALNMKRVARLAAQTPLYERYKYALLGGILCEDFGAFFPEGRKPPTVWPRTADLEVNFYTAKTRYIFESRGINIDDWFMNFAVDANTNSWITPGTDHLSLAGSLAAADPDLQKFVKIEKNELDGADGDSVAQRATDCAGLAAKSTEVLK